MTALPPAHDSGPTLVANADAFLAYELCLDYERNAQTEEHVMFARILGYLILLAPSPTILDEIVKTFQHNGNPGHDALAEIAKSFVYHFIAPFKKTQSRTPWSSEETSPESDDRFEASEQVQENITSNASKTRTAHREALVRDGYRCVVSQLYDEEAQFIPGIDWEVARKPCVTLSISVQIVPKSSHFLSDIDHPARATIAAILQSFKYDPHAWTGARYYSLQNTMTMDPNASGRFNRLELWFEATDEQDSYAVRNHNPDMRFVNVPEDGTVRTFSSPDPSRLPLPSSKLLALHCLAAKLAHLSGSRKYIDRLEEQLEGMGVLMQIGDARSSDVLSYALSSKLKPSARS